MPNTRKPRHPTGPGAHAIDDFVNSMVAMDRGSVRRVAKGLRVTPPDGPAHTIAYTPGNQAEWDLRLKWVEKQAASYVLAAPVLYGVEWNAKHRKTAGVKALRLSIGLSLSMGQSHPKRYSCVLKKGEKEIYVAEGGHLPAIKNGSKLVLTSLPKWAEQELKRLPAAVITACELFQKRPEVQRAIATLNEQFTIELSDLDRLYRRKQGTDDKLYGLAPGGTDGSVAIEAELRRLQSVVLDRYRVRIRLRVLSLGVFEGAVPDSVLTA